MLAETFNKDYDTVYIYGDLDAINYIISVIDNDGNLMFSEKEIIKMFFQNYKDIDAIDFLNFLNNKLIANCKKLPTVTKK